MITKHWFLHEVQSFNFSKNFILLDQALNFRAITESNNINLSKNICHSIINIQFKILVLWQKKKLNIHFTQKLSVFND